MFFVLVLQICVVLMVLPLGLLLLLFGCWYGCCQALCLHNVCRRLRLPCSVRIHRAGGLEEEESDTVTYTYAQSDLAPDPWRFNVDVSISGVITKYRGRY